MARYSGGAHGGCTIACTVAAPSICHVAGLVLMRICFPVQLGRVINDVQQDQVLFDAITLAELNDVCSKVCGVVLHFVSNKC